MDIEDQRFTHSFYTMIDDEVKFILSKTNTDTVSTTSYQTLFREKKKEIITSILYKKAGQRIDTISQINQLVLKELKEMSELNKYFLNISNGCIDNCARYFDLADENVISSMISIFYAHYERFLKFKNFDERIFLMEKTNSDCSPVKLTPFKRQKILSQDFNMKRPTSFKTLDFDSLKNPSMIIKAGGINHLENEQMNLINKPISHNFNNFAMNLDAQQRNSTNSFRGLDVKELAQVIY